MAMSEKERQKKWQERQRAKGKKRLTVMIDQNALTIIEREKKRTRESLSSIVSRALLSIGKKVSDNDEADNTRTTDVNVSDNATGPLEHNDNIMERIVSLMGVVGLSPEEVAQRFNDENVDSLMNTNPWTSEKINALYTKATTAK
jgi:hypothetical protein